jgi:general transcription factor 3C polypeptide 5 (transcription factor C subunit 1)
LVCLAFSLPNLMPFKLVDSIKNFRFLAEKEDYLTTQEDDSMDVDIDPQLQNLQSHSASPKIKSNLRMFPPPIFIRQAVPLNYK